MMDWHPVKLPKVFLECIRRDTGTNRQGLPK